MSTAAARLGLSNILTGTNVLKSLAGPIGADPGMTLYHMDALHPLGLKATFVLKSSTTGDTHSALTWGHNFNPLAVGTRLITPGSNVIMQFEHEYDTYNHGSYGLTHLLSPGTLGSTSATVIPVVAVGSVPYADNRTVTGTNTAFGTDLRIGDVLIIPGLGARMVDQIDSQLQLRVSNGYTGPGSEYGSVGYFDLTDGSSLPRGASVAALGTAVTGVATKFATVYGTGSFAVGSQPRIVIAGESHFVASVASETSLTLANPHITGQAAPTGVDLPDAVNEVGTGGLLQNEQWHGIGDQRPLAGSALAQFPYDIEAVSGPLTVVADRRNTYPKIREGKVLQVIGQDETTATKVIIQAVPPALGAGGTRGTFTLGATWIEFLSAATQGNEYNSRWLIGQNVEGRFMSDADRHSWSIYDYTLGKYRFFINKTGSVGIGTHVPGALLTIGGVLPDLVTRVAGTLSLAGVTSGAVTIQTAAVAGTYTLTLPEAVGAAGTALTDVAGDGVLSWAAGGGGSTLPIADTTAVVKGSVDDTKLLRFEVDGFTTATTRVLTAPNFDGTIATLSGTETLANKTLTGPIINDENGLLAMDISASSSAVNHLSLTNAATGNGPILAAAGTDTDISLTIASKGDGNIVLNSNGGDITLDGAISTNDSITLGGALLGGQNATFGAITTTGNIELGHATANTLSASAGVLSIEGNVIYHQGGALGTPASGTVTNLTGTASININGTVGATTRAAGLFTTLGANSTTTLAPGTLTDTVSGLTFTATMPTTMTGTNNAALFSITSAGSSSQSNVGIGINYLAGYTGSSTSTALRVVNSVAGTGTGLISTNGNLGGNFQSTATTTGTNMGFFSTASGGNQSIGTMGRAITAKNSATNIGVVGLGFNSGSSPIQLGGYFGLNSSDPTFTSAALMADNGATTDPIFVARDNGTAVFTIADGGGVSITAATVMTGNLTANGAFISTPQTVATTDGAAAAVSLATLTSSFATGASSATTTTLAAGTSGQEKIISLDTDGGQDLVVTVSNPLWGGAGTLTFDDVADIVRLIYINAKWKILSNVGVVAA